MKILRQAMLLFCCLAMRQWCQAQSPTPIGELPVNVVQAGTDTSKPLILYITGDGGWNKFSKALATFLASKGYPVVALNAKEYFWKKKTPAQAGVDAAQLIRSYQKTWNRQKILLVGYSFGADVMPFVFNHLPADLSSHVVNISLLSPSANTDFEIHLSVMMGGSVTGGESVPAAINAITVKPLTLIFGAGENDFPRSQLRNKNFVYAILEGGHHYDGDEEKVGTTILTYVPKG